MRHFLALLVALILTGCPGEPAAEVRVIKPERGHLEARFAATGRVTSPLVRVASGVSGRLERVAVKENEKVRQGQVLARLESREARAEVEAVQAELEGARSRETEALHSLALKQSQLEGELSQARAGNQAAEARLAQAARPRAEDLAAARAGVEAAEARLQQATADLARSRKLFQQDVLSTSQLELAETQVKTARAALKQSQAELRLLQPREADLEVQRAELSQARAALSAAQSGLGAELSVFEDRLRAARQETRRLEGSLRSALARLDRYTVRAPRDGVVFQLLFEPGEVVDWQQPILTLITSQDVNVEAEVDEQDAARVALDMPVEVTFSSLPGQRFTGSVFRVATALEPRERGPGGSKVLRIAVRLDPPHPTLRDGLEAVVEGSKSLAKDALLLPGSAIYHDQGADYVTAVRAGKAARLKVELGQATTDQVEVKSGLEAGDEVVLEGGDQIAEGTALRARP
ncbi:MAG: hypothetical protein AMXMBFR33_17010 [Candidatus Xenobia bacterium]